jgi:hypothetical protein
MPLFIRETKYFIFDGRAVARPTALYLSGVKGGEVDIFFDNLVCFVVSVRHVAWQLALRDLFRLKTEYPVGFVIP